MTQSKLLCCRGVILQERIQTDDLNILRKKLSVDMASILCDYYSAICSYLYKNIIAESRRQYLSFLLSKLWLRTSFIEFFVVCRQKVLMTHNAVIGGLPQGVIGILSADSMNPFSLSLRVSGKSVSTNFVVTLRHGTACSRHSVEKIQQLCHPLIAFQHILNTFGDMLTCRHAVAYLFVDFQL